MSMEAVKYLKEYQRMCDTYKECDDCPMLEDGMSNCSRKEPEELVAVVERWSALNPITTVGDVIKTALLEIIPEDGFQVKANRLTEEVMVIFDRDVWESEWKDD